MSTFAEWREQAEKQVRDQYGIKPELLRIEFRVITSGFEASMEQVRKSLVQLADAMRPSVEAIKGLARSWAQLEQRGNFKVKNGRGGRKRRNRRNRRSAEVRPW